MTPLPGAQVQTVGNNRMLRIASSVEPDIDELVSQKQGQMPTSFMCRLPLFKNCIIKM